MRKSQEGQTADDRDQGVSEQSQPRSLPIASGGVQTSGEFAKLMSALMTDVINGAITPGVSNAAVNAGGKLLKVVELQMKYGTTSDSGDKTLRLCSDDSRPVVPQAQIRAEFQARREELDRLEKAALANG